MIKLSLFKVLDKITGYNLLKQVDLLKTEAKLNEKELLQVQKEKLSYLLNYAKAHSPYYKSLLSNIEITVSNALEVVQKIPILDKATLNLNIDKIVTQNKKNLIKQASSGSTGYRTIVFWTKDEQKLHRATQLMWWNWAGYQLGMPILQTGIT
jgi:phenylacetate-CoA ligase